MPKRSVYFKEEEDALYEKVKVLTETSGETIASVFVKAMQDYITKKEQEKQGFDEIKLFVGHRDSVLGDSGEEISFLGKLVGCGKIEGNGIEITESLYRTFKKKFLLYKSRLDTNDLNESTEYEIFDNAEELKKVQLMPEITRALRERNITTRRLDI